MDNYGTIYRYANSTQGMIIGALIILFVAWLTQIIRIFERKRSRLRNLAAKLPGPKSLPLIGNALQFACKPEQLLDRMMEIVTPYEDVSPMRFWLGPLLHVIVTKPRDIEVILSSQRATCKGVAYRFLRPFIGLGLISGSGHTWRSHRKLIAPMLNLRTLESYVDTIEKHSQILVKKLKPFANGIEFDIGPYLSGCTVDGFCEAIMGCGDVNAQGNPDQEFVHAMEKMYAIIHNRMMKVWLYPDCIYQLSPSYREQTKCQRIIHGFAEKLIAAKKKEFLSSTSKESVTDFGNSILEQLIRHQMQQGKTIINDEELRDEIFTIYLASQDTMALISNFTLLMLAIHKNVQEKLRNELREAMTSEDFSVSSLAELKYTEMVIKEVLRLFPIAPLLVRTLRHDLTLDSCVLPEGCEVAIATHVTHRSSKYWKNPEKFLPERFTAEEIAARHPYAYFPFSGGLMGCMGQKLAIMSLKTIIASVVRNYSLDTTSRMEDIKLKCDISIRCVNGFNLSLKSL